MKTKILSAIAVFAAINVQAQLDNLTNLSPEWIRTAARNASTDGTDAVVYNPGGVTKLGDGFHITIGNQSMFRKPSHTYDLGMGTQTREQDGSDAFLPNIYMSYNKNHWAVTGGMYVSGGGATANYPKGSINTDLIGMMAVMGAQGAYMEAKDQMIKASSYYLTGTLGAAYSFTDKISVGASIRYLSATNEAEAGMTLTSSPVDMPDMPLAYMIKETATGMGATIGMNITPTPAFNFSVRYETMTSLDFETDVEKDDFGLSTDGDEHPRDLPGVLATGIHYNFTDKFSTSADFNYYFQTQADWGKTTTAEGETETSELAGNAATYAIAFEYEITPSLKASLGTVYTNFAWDEMETYYTAFGPFETVPGNNISVNTGIRYKFSEMIALNLGFAHTMWQQDVKVKALNFSPMDVTVTTNNVMSTLGIGVDMKF